jgi:hypothetical protein
MSKKEKVESISHSMALQCLDTLQDYMGQTGSEQNDITAARKIHNAVRSPNSS